MEQPIARKRIRQLYYNHGNVEDGDKIDVHNLYVYYILYAPLVDIEDEDMIKLDKIVSNNLKLVSC